MGAIKYDFASLPQESDPAFRMRVKDVYAALAARGRPRPVPTNDKQGTIQTVSGELLRSPDDISRAELVAHLQTVAGVLLAKALASHEVFRTAGFTDDQAAKVVMAIFPAVFEGLPYGPNAVSAADVAAARA